MCVFFNLIIRQLTGTNRVRYCYVTPTRNHSPLILNYFEKRSRPSAVRAAACAISRSERHAHGENNAEKTPGTKCFLFVPTTGMTTLAYQRFRFRIFSAIILNFKGSVSFLTAYLLVFFRPIFRPLYFTRFRVIHNLLNLFMNMHFYFHKLLNLVFSMRICCLLKKKKF